MENGNVSRVFGNRTWMIISVSLSLSALALFAVVNGGHSNILKGGLSGPLALSKTSKESTIVKYSSMSTADKQALFGEFQTQFGRKYENDEEEEKRFGYFDDFLTLVDDRNEAELNNGGSATHGITIFADFSEEERKSLRKTTMPSDDFTSEIMKKVSYEKEKSTDKLTGIVDWSGIYTTFGVRDQGYCGSCWAFSSVQQVESDGIRLGVLTQNDQLSVQQLVSCDTATETHDVPEDLANYGCDGGSPSSAYEYIHYTKGITTEEVYPYDSYEGEAPQCKHNVARSKNYVVTVDEWYLLESEDDMITHVLSTGPLSVSVATLNWDSYTGGIMTVCGDEIDHGVQVVGVNLKEGYWVVKNQWSPKWGMNGYIHIAVGSNTCGIASYATYTKVSKVGDK
jgi:cysteine peptidase B